MNTDVSLKAPIFDRRRLLGLLAAVLTHPFRGLCETDLVSGLQIDGLWPTGMVPGEKVTELNYRVDATVLLLSIPVFRRSAVGAARVAVREIPEHAGRRMAIEFAAGSDPARAHGLDRSGWIREVTVEHSGEPVMAATFGLMSDSPEQSVEQARMAFRETKGEPHFVAIDGAAASGSTRSRTLHLQLPQAPSEGDSLGAIRHGFQTSRPAWKQSAWETSGSEAPMPFLYALLRALEQPGRTTETRYVFNDNEYKLHIESSPDPERGHQFAAALLTDSPERVYRVRGRIENQTKRTHPVQLQLWIDASGPLPCPLRVEFEPRSFLRLTLERSSPAPAKSSKEQI